MTIIEKLKELGFDTVDSDFYQKVQQWKSWYEGNVKGFHQYKVKTGKERVNCKRYSLGMAKKVSEDWANLLLNEKVKITLEGEREQAFIDSVFADNNFEVKGNEMQELKCALGTAAYIPRVVGAVRDGVADHIALDYVTVEHIFPLTWSNGKVDECAFVSITVIGGDEYLYMQIHRKNELGFYDIENRLYSYKDGKIGSELVLANVKGFENVPPVVHTGSKERQFVIDRPNIANNYDHANPLGISVYANAIDILASCDVAYDAFVQDFITGKRRLFVSPAAAQYVDGEPVFDPNDIAFYTLPEDVTGENKPVQEVGGDFAVQDTSSGVQIALNMLSSKCGMGENHYRFDNGSVSTATQIVSENSSMFRTVKKHEIVLDAVLKELCRIILRLGNSAMGMGLNEDVEISIDFDDSIIEDKATDFSRDMQMLNGGILNDWEFRAKWLNEDYETAKKSLPRMEDMTTEGQNEVE